MKALLMHRDRDFDPKQAPPPHAEALAQDLELNVILGAMAGDDPLLLEVARNALLSGLHNDAATILHRQQVLRDCLDNPAEVRTLFALATTAFERKSTRWLGIFSRYPGGILYESVDLLEWFMDYLHQLQDIARTQAPRFRSPGFSALFAMLRRELSDDYFAVVRNHLKELKFKGGVLESAELGTNMEGFRYVLRLPQGRPPNWLRRLIGGKTRDYTFHLHERDEAGARILADMRDRGINLVANALAQASDHILGFFGMLRTELAFYVGCLNLHQRIISRGIPECFPQPQPPGTRRLNFRGLHDVSLALTSAAPIVGNDLDADGKSLVIITGANQGGKSSFLRGVGAAQIMMQSGMFVAAESFAAEICAGIFTHYKREEDAAMKSGKLAEELGRMSRIIDAIRPGAILMFNESFASTNEREGSEIARQIVHALLDRGVKILFVTHLYDFAHGLFQRRSDHVLFLRAQRRPDGTRTFRLVTGEPLETSYGEDLYRKIFTDQPAPADPGRGEEPA